MSWSDKFQKDRLKHYKIFDPSKVSLELKAHYQNFVHRISDTIHAYFDPDFFNCTIEFFHHPITSEPIPNYRINLASKLFCYMNTAKRVAAISKVLNPILIPPYKVTLNARGSISAEFIDEKESLENMKAQLEGELNTLLEKKYKRGKLEARMERKLKTAFEPEICVVTNESYMFDEPNGTETYFAVSVVSFKFKRKTEQECKEMVKYVLRDEIPKLKSLTILVDVPLVFPSIVPPTKAWWSQNVSPRKNDLIKCWRI